MKHDDKRQTAAPDYVPGESITAFAERVMKDAAEKEKAEQDFWAKINAIKMRRLNK